MGNQIMVRHSVRSCFVNGQKACFHTWAYEAFPDQNGQIWKTTGIVEFEDGSVMRVPPEEIQFADGAFFGENAGIRFWKRRTPEGILIETATGKRFLNGKKISRENVEEST